MIRKDCLLKITILVLTAIFWVGYALSGESVKGKFYVVGVGPAGPEHATLKAIEYIKKSDVILCDEGTKILFYDYLKGKKILGDPWKGMFDYKGKPWREIVRMGIEEKTAFQKERIHIREEIVEKIKVAMAKGKNVALLDIGDPCIFGPSHWFIEGFNQEEVEIVPGVGAFSAAMAALKKSSIPAYDTRFVMQTAPLFLFEDPDEDEILKDLSKYTTTMVFYMALESMDKLISKLRRYYSADLPIAIVYYAGYPDKEKIIQGTLDTILDRIKGIDEKFMGMVIIGKCLEGKPYRGRLEHFFDLVTVEQSGVKGRMFEKNREREEEKQ